MPIVAQRYVGATSHLLVRMSNHEICFLARPVSAFTAPAEVEMPNFRIEGHAMMLITASENLSVGDPVIVGHLFGVAAWSVSAGESVDLVVVGEHRLPKVTSVDTAELWGQGDIIYFDELERRCTKVPGLHKRIGIAAMPAAAESSEGYVRLDGAAS